MDVPPPDITHGFIEVAGIRVAYREAVPADRDVSDRPTLLLLHGFPSGSHMFRRLMDVLGKEHHVVAPDYPGFGPTGVEASGGVPRTWTFESLTDTVEAFLVARGLNNLVVYVFDWGGPVGFRLATRHPSWVRGLIIQNANAYLEGLSDGARAFVALTAEDEGAPAAVHQMLQEPSTVHQYLNGVRNPAAVAPESWLLDQTYLDRGARTAAQTQLAFDYKSNLALYPTWQQWLREHQPPTLVVWGKNDPFFVPAGALAYLDDLPHADIHLLDSGHFALEERLGTIAALIADFLRRVRHTAHSRSDPR